MSKFLMISRVLYDKGYQLFVDAAREIKSSYPDAKFYLLGDIDEFYPNRVPIEVIQRDVTNGWIDYLGYKTNVRPIINECDCIVHPTYYNEGLSRVLIEALALKKPIIASKIPGCKETVIDGVNGFLFESKNTKDLVRVKKKFLLLSDEDKRRMGEEGRILAELTFDVNDVIKIYKSITTQFITRNKTTDKCRLKRLL